MTHLSGAGVARAGEIGKGDLYAYLQFSLEFEAKEMALWRILNRLGSHRMFVAVTSLELQKKRAAELDARTGSVGIAPPGPGETVDGKKIFPSRRERMLCGREQEEPVTVRMGVNVYRFRRE